MPAVELTGRPAAPGLALGSLHRLAERTGLSRAAGTPAEESAALTTAIATASAALIAIMAEAEGEGADILEFQVAMLADDELAAPAFAAIAAGIDAAGAWRTTLDETIAGYRDGGDDYFAARASDLEDIRDRVLAALAGEADESRVPPGAILVGRDVTPSLFLSVDWKAGGAIALSEGSPSSHVAMLARARGVPMVVGLGSLPASAALEAIVDGDAGRLILDPDAHAKSAFARASAGAADRAAAEAEAARLPGRLAEGSPVRVLINVAEPEELDAIDPAICDGIGLVRTEFLFHRPSGLPDEETQYRAYRRMLEWAGARPVTIRTVDAGGDKPVPGLTIDGESNPFLGTRGVRLSLLKPEIFRVQLRALARAALHGNLKVMLPMVTVPGEIEDAARLLDAAVAELAAEGVPHARPPLGIMVEVPAVAVVPELYAGAAFFSIGSNDLTQYATAAARDIAAVAPLCDAGHPAVAALIAKVVRAGEALGREVSLCGDMGGDPRHLPALVGTGLRSVSVAPRLVGRVKRALAAIGPDGAA